MNPFARLLLWFVLAIPCAAGAAGDYAAREEVQAFIAEMRDRHGFDSDELRRLFGQAQMLPTVIKYILPPSSPRQRSWRAYRPRYIDSARVAGGLAFWQRNEPAIKAASEQYGVPPEIIVAIIGVETVYGRNVGDFETFSALTTLAFDYPPRAELFRRELGELLLLAREQQRDVRDFRGSYAGALGLPQFLPSSWRSYAVDFDGDGRVDLFGSPADAIGSVARFLGEHGWERDKPVTLRVTSIDGEPKPLLDSGIEPLLNTDDLDLLGVKTRSPAPLATRFALIDLITPDEPTEYWLGFHNFYVITRYNRSSFYAMSVYQLGEALRVSWQSSQQAAR
ncbi:MAG: lytic murein transglycosylase B [Candidatus Methylophosphatis roskildensis]